jgi:hypothetical protein
MQVPPPFGARAADFPQNDGHLRGVEEPKSQNLDVAPALQQIQKVTGPQVYVARKTADYFGGCGLTGSAVAALVAVGPGVAVAAGVAGAGAVEAVGTTGRVTWSVVAGSSRMRT